MSTQKLKIVLLPGLDGTGDLFRRFVAALPDEFESKVLSYRGDEYDDYGTLAAQLGASLVDSSPYVLLAESFSTPLAIEFAASHPKNLKNLILCAGFATSPLAGLLGTVCSLLAPLLFRIPLSAAAARYFLLGADSSGESIADLKRAISQVKSKVLVARLRAVLACDVTEPLRRIKIPILYIRASRDRLISRSSLEAIERVNPHVASASIEGPHLIVQQRPVEAAEIVAEFVSSLEV